MNTRTLQYRHRERRETQKRMQFETLALLIGALYAAYFAASIAATASLATASEDEAWPLDFGFYTVFTTIGLHFAFTAGGYALYTDYDHTPVQPKWAFLFADFFQAGALGAAIASFVHAPTDRTTLYAALSIVMASQLLCFHKTRTLVRDVRSGKRDPESGRLLYR